MKTDAREWDWPISIDSSPTVTTGWEVLPTLLGGADPQSKDAAVGAKIAAYGDLRCQALCLSGGDYGTTATHRAERTNMCRKCAVKRLGIENLPTGEQNEILEKFELRRR
jgi:hypothetical protein